MLFIHYFRHHKDSLSMVYFHFSDIDMKYHEVYFEA